MRRYTIPQPMTVEYFLGDHLGSTSITTDAAGAKVSEMRYKPWGEVRSWWTASLSTTPAYKLPQYTFTGQFSHMDDPSTPGVTEGFGLMFYVSRMYDPYLNHFTQPDSIVPDPYNPQDWNRYSYVRYNPIRYADPTGHNVDCGISDSYCESVNKPKDNVDSSELSTYVYKGTGVSGKMMYEFYRNLLIERNGYLTVKQFVEMIMAHEFLPYQKNDGTLNFIPGSNFNKELLMQTTANWYWGLHKGESSVTSEGMLNWVSAFASAGFAYKAGELTGTKADGLAYDVISFVYSLPGITRNDPTAPSTFGNLSMFPTDQLRNASQGNEYNQYIAVWPNLLDGNPAFILSACQNAYFKGDIKYVEQQCK